MNVTNVTFENFSGTTSGKHGRAVGRLSCSPSPDAVCEGVAFKNFTVTSPCGDPVVICDNIRGGIGVDCVDSTSAEAVAALGDTCTVPQAALPEPTPWLLRHR